MKRFLAECGVCCIVYATVIITVGPLASPGTLAFKWAMRFWTGL
jgi:hypothetical protein